MVGIRGRFVYDIETDGLYNQFTKIHCIRAYDLETNIMHRFDEFNEPIFRGIKLLNGGEEIIGHNILSFDTPALRKYSAKFTRWKEIKQFDTMVASTLIHADVKKTDAGRAKAGNLPSNLIGSQSLMAWGYRLKEYKGEYGKRLEGESDEDYMNRVWKHGCQEMYDYCEQDVMTNVKLYNMLQGDIIKRDIPQRALDVEHKFAKIISRQERHGVMFDIDKATQLEQILRIESANALDILLESYTPKYFVDTITKGSDGWCQVDYDYAKSVIIPQCIREVIEYDNKGKVISAKAKKQAKQSRKNISVSKSETWFFHPNSAKYKVIEGELYQKVKVAKKKTRKKRMCHFTNNEFMSTNTAEAGAMSSPLKLQVFNPNSGKHVIRWLKDMFDWQPTEFTDAGNPKTDGDTLGALTYDGIKELQDYQLVTKRLGQLADADGALIKKFNKKTGRINGRCNTLGAVTRRCTHSSPNLAQIPAGRSDKEGFILGKAGNGWGNEFRDLFITPKGYKMVGADGSGLELRTLAHYLTIFDGGAYAEIVLNGDIHTKNQLDAGLPTRNDAKTFIYAFLYGAGDIKLGEIVEPNANAEVKRQVGARLKKKFMDANPALKEFLNTVKDRASERKFVYDLDGNKLYIRSTHSAPNMLLQSCGAIVMKYWSVEVDEALQEMGLENSDDVLHTDRQHDYENVLNIHDEEQLEVKEEVSQDVAKVMKDSFPIVGRALKMNIKIEGEADVGSSWKYTH